MTDKTRRVKTIGELLSTPEYFVSGIDSGIILLAGGMGGRKEEAAGAIRKMTGYPDAGEIRDIEGWERLLYDLSEEPVIATIHANGIKHAIEQLARLPVRSMFLRRFRVIIGVPNRFEHPDPVLYVLPDPFKSFKKKGKTEG